MSEANQAAVEVQNLSRRFRGNAALKDVNLEIPIGSIFGLVGLNGAGKTTLIRHLIGALKPQTGRVTILGGDPAQAPESVLKKVGYLTEEDSLPKWMCLGDLIDFTRVLYPTWDQEYARDLCETFDLTRSTRLSSLSKGGRARAGLLIAIAHRPELLILDEPSSGLDPIARSDILEAIIRTVSEDGRTVLFSSHLLGEVDRVCDSVALMHHGQIVESLKTEQLETRYCEVLCRTETATPPPHAAGTFGWKRRGQEWSAVIETQIFEESAFTACAEILQRRSITLDRWFEARVGTDEGEMIQPPQTSEVVNDG